MGEETPAKPVALSKRPEDLIYQSCYAPVDLRSMLAHAETRSRIRRLPAAQLFFSLKELDDEEISQLLPHVTEEQWSAVLDLEIWRKDRMSLPALLGWQRHVITAEAAVARKLVRAAEPELWELAFRRGMRVYEKIDQDEFEDEPDAADVMETPDGQFLVAFPGNREQAKVMRGLLQRLYELDPATTALLIQEARFRTPMELEEEAYQNRRRRLEDLGFPDYYDALSVYSPIRLGERLRSKPRTQSGVQGELPVPTGMFQAYGPLLLFQCLAANSATGDLQALVEELFLFCNRLLAADRVPPGDSARIRRGIRKAVCGINLGLSLWSGDDLQRATAGLREHFLLEFFQLGFGALCGLREEARQCLGDPPRRRSLRGMGLLRRYPVLLRRIDGKVKMRFLRHAADLAATRRWLERQARLPDPEKP